MIIILISLFILFLIWSVLMSTKKLNKIDNNFYNVIKITYCKTKMWKFITFLGSAKFISIICLFLLIFLKNKNIALIIISDILIMWLLIGTLKNIFKRPRPNINQLVKEKGYSYPSGHTMTATVFYSIISFLIILSNLNITVKIILIAILILFILLIAFSRIYLGVHYFSDVIGAILFGTCYSLLYIYFTYFILNLI